MHTGLLDLSRRFHPSECRPRHEKPSASGFMSLSRIFSICRGQALAVALAGRRKAVPLPRIIEKIPSVNEKRHCSLQWRCSSCRRGWIGFYAAAP